MSEVTEWNQFSFSSKPTLSVSGQVLNTMNPPTGTHQPPIHDMNNLPLSWDQLRTSCWGSDHIFTQKRRKFSGDVSLSLFAGRDLNKGNVFRLLQQKQSSISESVWADTWSTLSTNCQVDSWESEGTCFFKYAWNWNTGALTSFRLGHESDDIIWY